VIVRHLFIYYLLFSFDIATFICLYCNVSSWQILRLSAH